MDTKISLLLECRKKLEQAAALAEEVRQMEINGIQQPNNPPVTFEIAEGKISYVAMVRAELTLHVSTFQSPIVSALH